MRRLLAVTIHAIALVIAVNTQSPAMRERLGGIVKQLVELQGGSIAAESRRERGTTFAASFPG